MLALERTLTERKTVLAAKAPRLSADPVLRPEPSGPSPLRLRPRSAAPHHGDSCGVGLRRLRPQPQPGHGAGPRAGLRRGASVQQPVLHRGGRVRDGVVSGARSLCFFTPTVTFALAGTRVDHGITAAGFTRVAWIDGKSSAERED